MPKREGAGRKPLAHHDPKILDRVVEGTKIGLSRVDACRIAGISTDTLERYEERGHRGEEPYATWLPKLVAARAEQKAFILRLLEKAIDGDWRAGAWLLEKLYPKEFGKHQTIVHEGDAYRGVSNKELKERMLEVAQQLEAAEEGEESDDDDSDT